MPAAFELAVAAQPSSKRHPSEKAKGTDEPPLLFFGRGDKIRTCDFYVPNVALYQAEPHLVIELFLAPRALPVVTKPLSSLLCNLPIGKSLPLLFVRFFRHGGAHKRPQAEPHLVLHETSAQAMRNCISYPYIITQLRRFVNIYFKSSAFLFKVSINPVPVYIV